MNEPDSRPRALLLHGGDLADIRNQLEQLDVSVCERESVDDADLEEAWDLVIATPRTVPELKPQRGTLPPTRIVVVREDARTLRARLRRQGVDLVLRRPFHPTALRLLLLRKIYRGPEKRLAVRVSVGAPVRVRAGFRSLSPILAELSIRGCRLLGERSLRVGSRITLVLPSRLTNGRPLRLRGQVLRSQAAGSPGGEIETAVSFVRVPAGAQAQLEAVVSSHATGPAVLPGGAAAPFEPDRRRQSRHIFSRRVIALGEEAARVLIGRDLSLGGMRVEPGTPLEVGESLRLALHSGGEELPLVLTARVLRDDGERGFVLQFSRLGEAGQRYLEQLLNRLPSLADLREQESDGDIVVSELLERDQD